MYHELIFYYFFCLDYYQLEIALLTQLRKFKMFCVHPRISKNEVVLVGVAYVNFKEHMNKVADSLSAIAKKPVNVSLLKYASSMYPYPRCSILYFIYFS